MASFLHKDLVVFRTTTSWAVREDMTTPVLILLWIRKWFDYPYSFISKAIYLMAGQGINCLRLLLKRTQIWMLELRSDLTFSFLHISDNVA